MIGPAIRNARHDRGRVGRTGRSANSRHTRAPSDTQAVPDRRADAADHTLVRPGARHQRGGERQADKGHRHPGPRQGVPEPAPRLTPRVRAVVRTCCGGLLPGTGASGAGSWTSAVLAGVTMLICPFHPTSPGSPDYFSSQITNCAPTLSPEDGLPEFFAFLAGDLDALELFGGAVEVEHVADEVGEIGPVVVRPCPVRALGFVRSSCR